MWEFTWLIGHGKLLHTKPTGLAWCLFDFIAVYIINSCTYYVLVFLCYCGKYDFSCCCLERMNVQRLNVRLITLWRRQTAVITKLTQSTERHCAASTFLVKDTHTAISWHRKDLARNVFMTRFAAAVMWNQLMKCILVMTTVYSLYCKNSVIFQHW